MVRSAKRLRRSNKIVALVCGLVWAAVDVCIIVYLFRFNPGNDHPILIAAILFVHSVPAIGAVWMIMRSYTLENHPLRYILIAMFVPFAFVWYYLERAKGKGMADHIR